MRLRKLSILFLLIFTFTAAAACQSTNNQGKQAENEPTIAPQPKQPDSPVNSASPVGSENPMDSEGHVSAENPVDSKSSESSENPVSSQSPVNSAAEPGQAGDLPPLDIKVIESHFQGEEGTFVWKAIDEEQYMVFGEKLAGTEFSPCSTFKIPNALIGLELGVVQDKNALKKWDGTRHRIVDWNRDHTLESAIQYSALWYFRELARDIGAENMQQYMDAIGYGNGDISGGIDQFWLDSTLKISPYDQVKFLEKLYKGDLPFREETISMVMEMIVLESLEGGTLSGKTGTGNYGGWFIGYYETSRGVYLFSAYMKNKQGREVKETVIKILNEVK